MPGNGCELFVENRSFLDARVLVGEEVGRARRRVESKARLEKVAVHLAGRRSTRHSAPLKRLPSLQAHLKKGGGRAEDLPALA